MKKRSAMCAEAVAFPADVVEYFGPLHEDYKRFLTSNVADAQLEIIKTLCQDIKDDENQFLKFLSMVFIHVSNKHPIKAFTLRYIMRSYKSHNDFSETLSKEIINIIESAPKDPKIYANNLITIITPCYENFPPGAEAARKIDLEVFAYLKDALTCSITALAESQLSPTSRNELYSLTHMSLKLMLQLLQQSKDDRIPVLQEHFDETRKTIKKVFLDEEVPKDSKTLGGIVLLLMHLLEHGRKEWIDVFKTEQDNNPFTNYLTNDAEKLVLYTAVVTLAPPAELQTYTVDNIPAIIKITTDVLAIGERTSSDSTFTLLVGRTVVQIAKFLRNIEDFQVGSELVRKILDFIWSHLEHYMDSVRHLASQSLACVIEYFAGLPDEARKISMDRLVEDLNGLDRGGKSFYVCAAVLAKDCGAVRLINKVENIVDCLLGALSVQALQSSALNCIDVMLARHLSETNVATVNFHWTLKILEYISKGQVDSTVLDLLRTALNRAIKLDSRILTSLIPLVQEIADADYEGMQCSTDLKRALFLLNVIRSSDDFAALDIEERYGHWKGLISYRMLKTAATLASEETRILALSIVVCSLRSTEPFGRPDLDFMIHFLKYNMDPQSSGFKQCMLSYMDKFLSRFTDSYKAANRRNDTNTVTEYATFIGQYTQVCYDSLLPGLNHRRREFSLCLLLRMHRLKVDPTIIPWKYEYVERLLGQLEDTYEQTVDSAYIVLGYCPEDLIKHQNYAVSIEMEDILWQASSSKPNETVSASYKLLVARTKTRENIIGENRSVPRRTKERIDFILMKILLYKLREHMAIAQQCLLTASEELPMYGILRCMLDLVKRVNVKEISTDVSWTNLINELILTCFEVNEVVAPIVNSASPEGLLPAALVTAAPSPPPPPYLALPWELATSRIGSVYSMVNEAEVPTVSNDPPEGFLPSLTPALPVGALMPIVTSAPSGAILRFPPPPAPLKGTYASPEVFLPSAPPLALLASPGKADAGASGNGNVCLEGNEMVLPTAGHASPEGLLPSPTLPAPPVGAVAPIVTNILPEGLLPCAPPPPPPPPAPPAAPAEDDDPNAYTLQMQHDSQKVLLCCWRSVKESSLLLGELVARFSISGEGQEAGNLTQQQVLDISEYFIKLLLGNKHRGAVEQAHVGFSKLLKRVLQCSSPALHELPAKWLSDLMAELAGGEHAALSATRRSAGFPFMIQALVTSEIQVKQNPRSFQQCMSTLLATARAPLRVPKDDTRAHCLNILRALYRNTTLGEVAASRVGEGLMLAIDTFDSENWTVERNSASLLFSALMTRVFGVQRNRGLEALSPRNCLTGRVFFQRYPYMYDFMLKKMEKLSVQDPKSTLQPSLFPILLILSRLHPSALEGTASNLKLEPFIPYVQICAQSIILKTRVVAAKAMVPLFTPELIGPYLLKMVSTLSKYIQPSNYTHGILLVLIRILETSNFPKTPKLEEEITEHVSSSTWLLAHDDDTRPRFALLAEYAAFINQLLHKYPQVLNEPTRVHITRALQAIVFDIHWTPLDIGKEYGLANSNYLLFVVLNKFNVNDIPNHIIKSLKSPIVDVIKTALKYLLLIHNNYSNDNGFMKHLNEITDKQNVLREVRDNGEYINILANIMKTSNDTKVQQKALKLLTLEPNTQEVILTVNDGIEPTDMNDVVTKLTEFVIKEDNLKHIYLDSLLKYVAMKIHDLSKDNLVTVMKEVMKCTDDEACAEVILKYLAENVETIFAIKFESNQRKQRFEYNVATLSTLVLLMESDSLIIRQSAADVIAELPRSNAVRDRVIPSRAGDYLCKVLERLCRDEEEKVALYTAIGLLDRDFDYTAPCDDENQAFDPRPLQSDEVLWVDISSLRIKAILATNTDSEDTDDDDSSDDSHERIKGNISWIRNYFRNILNSPAYADCLEELCSNCYPTFKRYLDEYTIYDDDLDAFNRKVELFIDNIFGYSKFDKI